jgi:hypothetical protein
MESSRKREAARQSIFPEVLPEVGCFGFKREKAGVSARQFRRTYLMCKQTAYGRHARSVCIVSDLAARLQGKNRPRQKLAEAKVIRIGSTKVFIGITATGELVIETDPP